MLSLKIPLNLTYRLNISHRKHPVNSKSYRHTPRQQLLTKVENKKKDCGVSAFGPDSDANTPITQAKPPFPKPLGSSTRHGTLGKRLLIIVFEPQKSLAGG